MTSCFMHNHRIVKTADKDMYILEGITAIWWICTQSKASTLHDCACALGQKTISHSQKRNILEYPDKANTYSGA